MQPRYQAPFLHKTILIEFLNTYTGKDLIEEKEQPSMWGKISNGLKSAVNLNTPEDSENWYKLLRSHIDNADHGNIKSWIYLICHTGIAGHTTRSRSFWGSALCRSAFALRAYILNSVNKMYSTIEKGKPLTKDQALALGIKKAIQEEIDKEKEIITLQNQILKLRKESDPIYTNKAFIFDFSFESYKKVAEESLIEHSQRKLCYLGGYEILKEEKYQIITDKQKSIKELFPKFAVSSELKLDKKTEEIMSYELPIYFQKPYDAIFIRLKEIESKKTDPKGKDDKVNPFDAETVINTFEFNAMNKVKEPVSQPKQLVPLDNGDPSAEDDKKKQHEDESLHVILPTSDNEKSNEQEESFSPALADEKQIEQPTSVIVPELKEKPTVKIEMKKEESLQAEKNKISTSPQNKILITSASPSLKGVLLSLGLASDNKESNKPQEPSHLDEPHSPENPSAEDGFQLQRKKNRKNRNREENLSDQSQESSQSTPKRKSR